MTSQVIVNMKSYFSSGVPSTFGAPGEVVVGHSVWGTLGESTPPDGDSTSSINPNLHLGHMNSCFI